MLKQHIIIDLSDIDFVKTRYKLSYLQVHVEEEQQSGIADTSKWSSQTRNQTETL